MRYLVRKWYRGSLTVEASLVAPVMLIVILPFIYLIRMLMVQSVLEAGLDNCLQRISVEAYVLERMAVLPEEREDEADIEEGKRQQLEQLIDEYADWMDEEKWKDKLEITGLNLAGQWLLKARLQEWLEGWNVESWGIEGGWEGISLADSRFFYAEGGHHKLLKGVLTFKWKPMFSFWEPEEVKIQRVYHGFMGEKTMAAGTQGSETEQDQGEMTVYRIGQGTRYHSISCYLIKKDTYCKLRAEAEAEGKTPCIRCNPKQETTVYCTVRGEHYHTAGCSYLYPDLQSLSLEEAIQRGYTGCGLCQKGEGYFS